MDHPSALSSHLHAAAVALTSVAVRTPPEASLIPIPQLATDRTPAPAPRVTHPGLRIVRPLYAPLIPKALGPAAPTRRTSDPRAECLVSPPDMSSARPTCRPSPGGSSVLSAPRRSPRPSYASRASHPPAPRPIQLQAGVNAISRQRHIGDHRSRLDTRTLTLLPYLIKPIWRPDTRRGTATTTPTVGSVPPPASLLHVSRGTFAAGRWHPARSSRAAAEHHQRDMLRCKP